MRRILSKLGKLGEEKDEDPFKLPGYQQPCTIKGGYSQHGKQKTIYSIRSRNRVIG